MLGSRQARRIPISRLKSSCDWYRASPTTCSTSQVGSAQRVRQGVPPPQEGGLLGLAPCVAQQPGRQMATTHRRAGGQQWLLLHSGVQAAEALLTRLGKFRPTGASR